MSVPDFSLFSILVAIFYYFIYVLLADITQSNALSTENIVKWSFNTPRHKFPRHEIIFVLPVQLYQQIFCLWLDVFSFLCPL